jgi:hypothetical protein
MSIVSRNLGEVNVSRIGRSRVGPVSLKQEQNEPFHTAAEKINHWTRSFTRRPLDPPAKMLNYVPLKCDQLGSHAKGSALFDAPTPSHSTKLRVEKPTGFVTTRNPHTEIEKPWVPREYGQPLRAGARILQPSAFSSTPEPTAQLYRPAKEIHLRRGPTTNYNVGMYGLGDNPASPGF